MPRFPVAFGRRKSTADNIDNGAIAAGPSFRVLERSEVPGGKNFDGGARLAAKTHNMPSTTLEDVNMDDNLFADLKTNRGSGSSNTTKTNSTDTSSRHSNASTTPSSADASGHDEWRPTGKHALPDIPIPPIPKSTSSGFLKAAGRSFSFGGQKKHLPPAPVAEEPLPPSPPAYPEPSFSGGRARATTASTSATVTPPKVDPDWSLDLGGDFSKMLLGADKRGSVATVRNEQQARNSLGPRSLTAGRANQPSPIQIDRTSRIEPSPYSWNSQHSNEGLLTVSPGVLSPTSPDIPPPVPRHNSPLSLPGSKGYIRPSTSPDNSLRPGGPSFNRRTSDFAEVDEDTRLLKDSLAAVNKFMSSGGSGDKRESRYRRDESAPSGNIWRKPVASATPAKADPATDESLFDSSLSSSFRTANRYISRKPSPPRNKVMTPQQFERYRKDKERQNSGSDTAEPEQEKEDDDEEDNYEDDEDDTEKARQQAKQRRKQEAHMTVYRQQMMKVTGEANSGFAPSRPSLQLSLSTPNLTGPSEPVTNVSEGSEEDEEVPLAILAAHGFPSKTRPPTQLTTMMSNPNLRAATQPSYQRPGTAGGEASASANPRLPAFARNLPQDPFVGAGLVRNQVRESFALGGGAPAPNSAGPALPPGGLIGVIANEERSRAMRRGSPHLDGQGSMPPAMPHFDPVAGIPSNMMYGNVPHPTMLTPGDQAQLQMTQQMQQFMQMQMQFMQMMAAGGQGAHGMAMPGPGMMGSQTMGNLGLMHPGMGGQEAMRHSFVGNDSVMDLPRPDMHARSMSMVQPSSASWVQPPPPNAGYAPSIRAQGFGYAPSIAPSERSNIGLPGRYRPVSQAPQPLPVGVTHLRRVSTASSAVPESWSKGPAAGPTKLSGNVSDDDDEEGWQAMKAKRDKKRSLWKTKKTLGADIGALIS